MTTPRIEHRVGALARRVTRVEEDLEALTDTVYKLRRESIANRINLTRIAESLMVTVATDAEIDTVLDEEGA